MERKIYTSRFSNPELKTGKYTVCGIVRGMPKFSLGYALDGNIIQIAPPGYLFNENDREVFTSKYFDYMEKQKFGFGVIQAYLNEYLSMGKDLVLCCYEDVRIPGEWCHRLVFAEWYEKKTGIRIEELPDPSIPKIPKVKKVEALNSEPKKTEFEQMSLFSLGIL